MTEIRKTAPVRNPDLQLCRMGVHCNAHGAPLGFLFVLSKKNSQLRFDHVVNPNQTDEKQTLSLLARRTSGTQHRRGGRQPQRVGGYKVTCGVATGVKAA